MSRSTQNKLSRILKIWVDLLKLLNFSTQNVKNLKTFKKPLIKSIPSFLTSRKVTITNCDIREVTKKYSHVSKNWSHEENFMCGMANSILTQTRNATFSPLTSKLIYSACHTRPKFFWEHENYRKWKLLFMMMRRSKNKSERKVLVFFADWTIFERWKLL